mgnify:CR=1 FL=1
MNISTEEARKFWTEILSPIVEPLFNGSHPDKEIQEVITKLLNEVGRRYPYKIEVRLNDFFHPKSRKIYA